MVEMSHQKYPLDIDYQSIFEAAPDLYLLLDRNLRIINASDSYITATLVKKKDIIGRDVFEVFPDNPNDPFATGVKNLSNSFKRVLTQGIPDAMAVQKYDIPNKNGFEERFWSPVNSPVFDKDNQVQYIIHRVEDVTDFIMLKKQGALKLQLAEELKTREGGIEIEIYQRAQIIQEANKRLEDLTKALALSNEKLKTSNERLAEFAYIASHDLQEPLRMITNFLQLLKKRYQHKLDEEADEFINFAVNGAERLRTLINDLLMYSRVDSQGKPFKPTQLEHVLKWVLSNIEDRIQDLGVRLSYGPLPEVLGDEIQLGQVFQNLIQNSLRYRSPKRSLEIQIGVVDNNTHWNFFVKDNGIGINPEFHQRIFRIFQRLHAQRDSQGTGIGLAVCQRIVERHNGKIWVESEEDKGATFYFSLPKYLEEGP